MVERKKARPDPERARGGRNTTMLHDGRVRNVDEARLWHGGVANDSREAFLSMTKEEREALVRFVEAI